MLALSDGLAVLKSRWNDALLQQLLPALYAELLERVCVRCKGSEKTT
jgi:hypothetical protein